MLKITKATDAIIVSQIVMCIYAQPGIGKTTLAYSSDKPLLLDFDRGAHRALGRKDTVQVEDWDEINNLKAEDIADYNTIVVDTAGRALDCLTMDIIARNPKMGRGGSLTLQGYGELKSRFTAWTKQVRSLGKDIVLLAHSDESRSGDEVVERLDMQGGSKNEVYKVADVMGKLFPEGDYRVLNLNPTDTSFGKNPANLPVMRVPPIQTNPTFLAEVIANTKASLNQLSAEQQEVMVLMNALVEKVDACESPEDFTALIAFIEEGDERVLANSKRLVWNAAKKKKYIFEEGEGFKEKPKDTTQTQADLPDSAKTK